MKTKILLIFCTLLLTLSLCACNLAREDGLEAQSDRLVGVYITREYLDLFDFESYLNDNISSIGAGGEITVENGQRYNGRIYAALKPRTLTSEETGEESVIYEYVFEELDGIPFFFAEVTQPDGESYFASVSDNAVSDAHVSYGNETTLEGTIYMAPGSMTVLYVNPVYQSGDADVYVTSSGGYSVSGIEAEGAVFSTTLEETHTVTENGEKRDESFKVTIHINVKYPPVSISVIQMNAQNMPIINEKYSPGDLPENVEISPDTEYVIVETRSASPAGETLSREIFERGDEYFTSYTVRSDGVCEARPAGLLWAQK